MEEFIFTHDAFFKSLLDNKEYRYDLLAKILPTEVFNLLDLKKIKRINTTFVNEDLKSHYADYIIEIPLKDKNKGFITFIFEHKSRPQKYAAIQLLYYLSSAYFQQVFKNKEKPQLIIPIIYYQGKNTWNYLTTDQLFESLPAELKSFIPVFKTIFIDLNKYTDSEIESWRSEILSLTTYIQKHAFDKEFLESKMKEICRKIDSLEDRNLILNTFVYFINQSQITEDKIVNIVKELKHNKYIMSTLQLIEKRGEKRGIAIGEAKGEARGEARGISIVTEKVIVSSYKKGIEVSLIAEIIGTTTRKVKEILKKNSLL